jgi:hypothetical protein
MRPERFAYLTSQRWAFTEPHHRARADLPRRRI